MAAITFLNVNDFTKRLYEVTKTEYMTTTGEFHNEGLFSERIFGLEGSIERKKTFAYINLGTEVIHPTALSFLLRLDSKINKFITAESNFKLDRNSRLEVVEEGMTGLPEFIKIFPKIQFRGDTSDRKKMILALEKAYKDKNLFISRIPVIPPDMRPLFKDEHDNITVDALNDYYITIMRRASQVSSAVGSGPLFDLLVYGLQKSVIDHDNFVKGKIAKKPGIIRKSLLGKRIDFSGRAVITPDPKLKVNEMGIPFRLAVSLFEPFLLHNLLHSARTNREKLSEEVKSFTGLDLSVDSVQKVIKSIKNNDTVPQILYDIFYEALELAMEGRVIITKRDPVLHSESVRAMYPKLVKGNTITICTLQVGGFNADFDGDQMAVYHPITDEAQEEARTKLMNPKSPSTARVNTFELSKEMFSGLYVMSQDVSLKMSPIAITDRDELDKAVNPYIPVVFKKTKTTMGRAIINSCFPNDFPFVDKQFDKKVTNKIIDKLFDIYGADVVRETTSKLEKIGFKFGTIGAPSITLDQLELPPEILKLKEKLKTANSIEAGDIIEEMKKLLIKHLKGKGFYSIIESGSGKGWGQPSQILLTKGIVEDAEGNVLDPIISSFSDGLSNKEYFNASYGARKGICDRVINTADTGYMTRKLLFVCSPAEADPYTRDCGTKRVLNIKLTNDLIPRLMGRFIINTREQVEEFKKENFKMGQVIQLRSPIYCKSKKICQTCYGKLLKTHQSPYIGVLAAFIIGERGTQLIMRSFHQGGAVTITKRDLLQDIVNNDPLVNLDKNKLTKYIKQEDNKLVCVDNCILTINRSNYNDDNLRINEESIWVSSLIAQVEFEEIMFKIILDYPVNIMTPNKFEKTKTYIKIQYNSGNEIIDTISDTGQMKKQIHYVERLLGGKEVYRDVEHLLEKLFKVYSATSNMDIVHMEVLLSQCLRDKSDSTIPARLGKTWNPEMVNIKKVVFNSGFIQGLCFENINSAIQTGLIGGENLEPSIIEKVLTGTLVQGKK